METPSDRLVFSEASFAEQMMGIFAGDQAGLLNHLSRNTCLLIGLSLEDETLRSVLAQSARSNPGNYHYYVRFLEDNESLDDDKQHAIRLANFKVYNLITMFLKAPEIGALVELINDKFCCEDTFKGFAQVNGIDICFRFYLTGPLGVGKSTTVNHFRSLTIVDEWLEQRPNLLAKHWKKLTDEEKKTADRWIIRQFRLKNDVLRGDKTGLFMLDRGPLDPLSFTPEEKWRQKASRLLRGLCPSKTGWEVQSGHVILLRGDHEELALRMLLTAREDYSAKELKENEEKLAKAYGSAGVTEVDTRGLTASEVARRVAEIVHLEEYSRASECKLDERLSLIRTEGINAGD
jgi:hypothetical protein